MSIAGKVIGYLGSVFGLYPRSGGGIVVRQPGGTAGTDEIQVSHDGTNGTVECKDGYLQLISATKRVAIPTSNNFTILLAFGGGGAGLTSRSEGNAIGVTVGNTSTIDFNANQTVSRVPFCISTDPGTSAPDVGFGRASAGVWSFTSGASSTTGRTFSSPVLTPSQLTANQDNYAPGVAMHYRLSSDASRDITGLSVGQVDGQVCEIWNIGSNNIVLKHDVTSTAANRFLCVGSADLTLLPNDIALLRYDPTSQRWRVGKL